jgi:hypothetical protein
LEKCSLSCTFILCTYLHKKNISLAFWEASF